MENVLALSGASGTAVADRFLAMLPRLSLYLELAFRGFQPEQREDAFHEAVANAYVAFSRLWQQGRLHAAFPSVLARYAVVQWFAGRRVGSRLNGGDVLSPYAQQRHRFSVERLDRFDRHEAAWYEAVVEDHQTPVPDQVAFRLDFPEWLGRLSLRNRRIAETLAEGETTQAVARCFQLSEARVSQLRQEFHDSWERFQGLDPQPSEQMPAAGRGSPATLAEAMSH